MIKKLATSSDKWWIYWVVCQEGDVILTSCTCCHFAARVPRKRWNSFCFDNDVQQSKIRSNEIDATCYIIVRHKNEKWIIKLHDDVPFVCHPRRLVAVWSPDDNTDKKFPIRGKSGEDWRVVQGRRWSRGSSRVFTAYPIGRPKLRGKFKIHSAARNRHYILTALMEFKNWFSWECWWHSR